jgi:hypothetical protein
MALLAELKRHRLLRYAAGFTIADEDALLAIRPTILGIVSNDALAAALDADGVIEQEATVGEADPVLCHASCQVPDVARRTRAAGFSASMLLQTLACKLPRRDRNLICRGFACA